MTDLDSKTSDLPERARDSVENRVTNDGLKLPPKSREYANIGLDPVKETTMPRESRPSLRHDVQVLRDEILKRRLSLRELRIGLGQQRAKVREMEIQLWKELQSQQDVGVSVDPNKLFEDIGQAWDLLGPDEEEYNEKEDDLNVMELRLENLEADLYSNTGSSKRSKSSISFSGESPGQGSTETVRVERVKDDRDRDADSLMHQYLSKVGDARIIRERLHELQSERSSYLDTQRDREAIGYPQYQPNVDFLADYERLRNEEISQLQRVEIEIAILARKAGVRTTGSEDMLTPPVAPGTVTAVASIFSEQNTATPTDIFHTQHRPLKADCYTAFSDTMTAHQRINDWILHILQMSPLEHARHRAILDDPDLDDSEWLRLVKEYWQTDEGVFDDAVVDPSRASKSPVLQQTTLFAEN